MGSRVDETQEFAKNPKKNHIVIGNKMKRVKRYYEYGYYETMGDSQDNYSETLLPLPFSCKMFINGFFQGKVCFL